MTSIVPSSGEPPGPPRGFWAKLTLGLEFRVDWPGADLLKAALDWIKRQIV